MTGAAQPSQTDNSWRAHTKGTLKIGVPLIAAQMAQQGIQVTDTVMLGWYGTEELAAVVLGTTGFFIAFIVAIGLAQAVMPLAASAAGTDDARGVRRSVRMGLWAVWLGTALMVPVLHQGEALFLLAGQSAELSVLADDYLDIALWGLFPAATVMALRSFLSATERTGIVMWATLGGVVINALTNWALIFGNWGAPEMGVRGAAVASVLSHTATLIPVALYCARHQILRQYEIFVRIWRPDWPAFAEVIRLGIPISATLLAEVGLFAASSIMMGWLGTIALAAHGIALQIISIIFMIPLGLAQAGTARIGRAHGRGDRPAIARAGQTVLVMSVGIALLGAAILLAVPDELVALFLAEDDKNAAAVVAVGAVLLLVAAVFQLVDTLQVVSMGLLRGLKDTRIPMMIALFSYWVIGIPAAYLFAFTLDFGGAGVWGGLAVGLSVAALFLTVRFFRRDRLGIGAF